MSDLVQVAAITGATTLLGTLCTIGLPLFVAHRGNKRRLDHITMLTNSTLAAANALVAQLQAENRLLVGQLNDQRSQGHVE